MGDEQGFLDALAEAPADLARPLVYADWLDDRGRADAACLRSWADLVATPYDDAAFRVLRDRVAAYQARLRAADPAWVRRVAAARAWVDARLADTVARLFLRVRHGRPASRQWLDRPLDPLPAWSAGWTVYNWRLSPDCPTANMWWDRGRVVVDRITAETR